jgi:hypothetical protein
VSTGGDDGQDDNNTLAMMMAMMHGCPAEDMHEKYTQYVRRVADEERDAQPKPRTSPANEMHKK